MARRKWVKLNDGIFTLHPVVSLLASLVLVDISLLAW